MTKRSDDEVDDWAAVLLRAADRPIPKGCCWVVVFDYREDNGPPLVGPFETKGAGEHWLSKQSGYEAHVAPVAWHDQWLPTQPLDPWPSATPPNAEVLPVVVTRKKPDSEVQR